MLSAQIVDIIVSGILQGSVYALIAAGLTLVFGVLHLLNIAHGDIMILGSFTSFWLLQIAGIDPIVSIPLAFLSTFVIGAAIYFSALKPVLRAPLLNQIVLTFGLAVVLEGLMVALWGGKWRMILTAYSNAGLDLGLISVSYVRVLSLVVSVVIFILLYILLLKTDVGRRIRAVAQNRVAATLLGTDVDFVYLLSFCLGSGLAGTAGVLVGLMYPFNPYSGLEYILLAFIVIVLGGMGSVTGAIIGGLVIGIIESVSASLSTQSLALVVLYVVFLIILSFRPTGLMGIRAEE